MDNNMDNDIDKKELLKIKKREYAKNHYNRNKEIIKNKNKQYYHNNKQKVLLRQKKERILMKQIKSLIKVN